MLKKRLVFSFLTVFALFALLISLIQYRYQKNQATEQLCGRMQAYCDYFDHVCRDSLYGSLPDTAYRLDVYSEQGTLLYRSSVLSDTTASRTHLYKETAMARQSGMGYNIRRNHTTGELCFYYLRHYPQSKRYIRIECPYDKIRDELRPLALPILLAVFLFLFVLVCLVFVLRHFNGTISSLRTLIGRMDAGDKYNFPDNEFRDISEHIVNSYKRLDRTEKALNMERERMVAHLKFSKRGLAIFSPQRKEIFSNELFTQYINLIADAPCRYPGAVFDIPEFSAIVDFLDEQQRSGEDKLVTKTLQLDKNDRHLMLACIVFQDKSFEITVDDISQKEEQNLLKRQLTQNISHELKTPVSSIQGFMETLLNNPDMDEEKKQFYIQRCYSQASRLTNLLQDISTLNKLDEASDIFAKEPVNLTDIIHSVLGDVELQLQEKGFSVETDLPEQLPIQGNTSLLYSIFRNLIDNSLHYAGENIHLTISCYRTDETFYYFAVSDNGVGVDEAHLARLFDRFYRVDKGRSRKLGGTGLGLAIVKNAIAFHQGRISAKPHQGGGLEFLFTLRKA
ncbi:MAG: two-component sensor histidine kinase [Paludibacteraceae bacterium]|nr:two-component sensor histidine kinase [Paludibacteraceae bacterium]